MKNTFESCLKRYFRIGGIALLVGIVFFPRCTEQHREPPHVLIYTKNGQGYVHDNIPASITALEEICRENGWTFQSTADALVFDSDTLERFDALIFSNTNNETFDTEAQRKAFQAYIRSGGGFVGIHSACGSERDWPWFWANLGGKFVRHPAYQPFEIRVIDPSHPSTSVLDSVWTWQDECYFMDHLNPDIHVLLAVDLNTVEDADKETYPGTVFGDHFPLCWCHNFDGGRQWYTALGHDAEHYQDNRFRQYLAGGIRWTLNKE
jgi:type 1 glutamine amidotransferase